ncbi:MAG: tRNA lysidine(34) synthetase TilS [Polyangiaceae bacterium]|nr:tRNA lysidine(34) synthetase TilS [Polyangiaceae bacterium]
MRGSHAPSLRTIARRALATELALAPPIVIVAACSGGPDSTAMLHVLATLRSSLGVRLSACAVDHGLRPEAEREIDVVRKVAASLDVPLDVMKLSVAPGANLMARAREARYAALREVKATRGAAFVATGHTADDRAETVLLRILRGAGPRGLAVLPARSGDLLRPIVRARRSDVVRHIERFGLPTSADPSNADPRFLRVRVRGEVLPVLESLAPRVVESLCALADDLAAIVPSDDPLTGLGRRQRTVIEAALKAAGGGPKRARIRSSDREEVLVEVRDGARVITELMSPKPSRRSRRAP